jgi:hypothetical protein
MKQLITSAEVISIAFGTNNTLREEAVPAHTILAAQRRFVRPVVGEEVFDLLMAESPTEECEGFIRDYLKVPLALYVASLMLPTLAVTVGSAGVVRLSGESFEAADGVALRGAVRRLRRDAEALIDAATEHLASLPTLGALYRPEENVRSCTRLSGGIVL